MAWQYTPYTAPVFLSAVVSLGIAAFAWQHRDRSGAAPLAVFLIGAGLWSFAEGMHLANTELASKVAWTRLEMALTGIVPAAWLALVLEYTGNDEWVTRKTVALLSVEPLAFVGFLVWAPELVRSNMELVLVDGYLLFSQTLGPVYYVHLIYSYLLVLLGGAFLVKVILFAEGLYRTQSTALLLAAFFPTLGNTLYTFGLVPTDPTNIGFLLTGVIIAGTILHRQLLEVVPVAREVARDELLDNMDDRVIVLDDRDNVGDLNDTALELIDGTENEAIGKPIEEVLPVVARLLDASEDDRMQAELSLESESGVRYYDVRVSPLHRARGMVAGRLVSLRDVTEKRQQRQQLDVLNRLLRHNLRNEMNVISGNAELVGRKVDDPELIDRIQQIASTAGEITSRSDKVGRVTRLLENGSDTSISLLRAIEKEVTTLQQRYPGAEITVDIPSTLDTTVGPSLAIAVNELVTNGIEHNDGAPVVHIRATETEDGLAVTISDNGPGIDEHELEVIDEGKETALQHGSGVGLWVVNWLVQQFGGRLDFENTPDGCTVTIRLPQQSETAAPEAAPAD